jgi:putative transposase
VPTQTWRTSLTNHVSQIVAADFFVVPTATFRLLFVLVILAHERRRVVHVAVTDHPTAAWTVQQLREAFPWDQTPRYLVRDRDHAFDGWAAAAKAMGMTDVRTALRSPWQNGYVERFIGSVRRECLDHVIVFSATGLQRLLHLYCDYYEGSRTHLSLAQDTPIPRAVAPPTEGRIVAIPQVGASITATSGAPPDRHAPATGVHTSIACHERDPVSWVLFAIWATESKRLLKPTRRTAVQR